ncbi:MAG: PEP-CTERM/exosortase system-associated acyltransferase [Pseudobdellovibrionaceae bacterium]|jgi:N-acyl amino acid synthase of PEP-CTERM/exosortase system|nr:PEP-CTERM/exosortase system-associated acyltransferase [Pseudobdellovibrionaceae bacterium]
MARHSLKEGFFFLCANYWDNIKETFNLMTHAYRVLPAESEQMKREAFKIRHKVYCSELKYEDTRETGMEEDEFDSHSSHMVLYSRSHKSYIGCARLVHGRHNGVAKALPFEHHCENQIDHKILNSIKNSGHGYAEVSRLAIEKSFRNMGQKKERKSLSRQKNYNAFALISLYLGVQAMAKQQGIRYLFAIVEPRLLRNLHHHNVPAIQIGKGVDHRGLRVPIMIDVEDIERIIPSALKTVYSNIKRDIKEAKPAYTGIMEETLDIPPLYSTEEQEPMHEKMAQ